MRTAALNEAFVPKRGANRFSRSLDHDVVQWSLAAFPLAWCVGVHTLYLLAWAATGERPGATGVGFGDVGLSAEEALPLGTAWIATLLRLAGIALQFTWPAFLALWIATSDIARRASATRQSLRQWPRQLVFCSGAGLLFACTAYDPFGVVRWLVD